MALSLSIIRSPSGVSLGSSQKVFSEQGGSIGRGEGNDWVLGDPDRFLSSRHCQVGFEAGQYYLTDTSTNGTFINSAPEPLGKGGRIPLNDGDTIEMGDYQFRVELQSALAASADPFAAPVPPPPVSQPSMPSEPFASLDDPFAPSPLSTPPPAPHAALEDPFAADPFAVTPPSSAEFSLNPDPLDVDPLAALDKAGGADNAPFSDGHSEPLAPGAQFTAHSEDPLFSTGAQAVIDDDFLSAGPSHSDGAGALNQSMSWPDTQNEHLIPEDWEEGLLGAGVADAPPQPSPAANVPKPDPVMPTGVHRSIPLTEPPTFRKPASAPPPTPKPAPSKTQHDFASAQASVPQSKNKPALDASPAEPKNSAKAGVAQAAGDALLQGMGLSEKNMTDEDIAELHAIIGELMPVIIQGMMQVLRARASIKNEFRMNVTTIQPVENNPLKFSADVSEAMENMFVRRSGAYTGPVEAFQEGFDGIGEHQVAIIAGIREAFKSMMDRFNPELLERQFESVNKGLALPGMQKAKLWSHYVNFYNGFINNMESTFQYLFGDEFVQAYEDQLRRLESERKRRKNKSS